MYVDCITVRIATLDFVLNIKYNCYSFTKSIFAKFSSYLRNYFASIELKSILFSVIIRLMVLQWVLIDIRLIGLDRPCLGKTGRTTS
jgi:hypothetical protein